MLGKEKYTVEEIRKQQQSDKPLSCYMNNGVEFYPLLCTAAVPGDRVRESLNFIFELAHALSP